MGVYFVAITALAALLFAYQLYKLYRSHKLYAIRKAPKEVVDLLGDTIDEDHFVKTQNYHKEINNLEVVKCVVSFISTVLVICTPLLKALWDITDVGNIFISSILFDAAFNILSTIINLPLGYYMTFVIRAKYDMNRMTLATFFKDTAKMFLLQEVLSVIIISFLLLFADTQNLAIYLWAALVTLMMVINIILVPVIIPLFYNKKPLEDEELKKFVFAKLDEVDFHVGTINVIDASTKMSEANAMVAGFIKKDVIIFDNLLQIATKEEVVDTILHEVGHFKHHDILKLNVLNSIYMLGILKFMEFFLFDDSLYREFGFMERNYVVGVSLLSIFLQPVNELLSVGINYITRKCEFGADAFATDNGYHFLGNVLIKLTVCCDDTCRRLTYRKRTSHS